MLKDILIEYIGPFAVLLFFGWRYTVARRTSADVPKWKAEGAAILDVRSVGEFASGSCPGSINIPLDQLPNRLHELDKNLPHIVCCASGVRSAMAAKLLKSRGFERVMNAGPWSNTLK